MAEDTEAHLKAHAQYFDGLLSLIPAKLYFAEDNSDQWQRTKQTKEQAKEARRAKLNPLNAKSAKDVFDENARKRKREEGAAAPEAGSRPLPAPAEKAEKAEKPAKKQKLAVSIPEDSSKTQPEQAATSAQKAKAEQSQSRKERKRTGTVSREEKAKSKAEQRKQNVAKAKEAAHQTQEPDASVRGEAAEASGNLEGLDSAGLSKAEDSAPTPKSASPHSPVFDAPATQSGTSSISSFPDLSTTAAEIPILPAGESSKPSQEELKLRLQKRLQELRAARKADNEDGTPARSRQDLIEERRMKDEERKAHKKELRKQQKEEERLKKEDEMARGSPLMSPSIKSPAGRHGLLGMTEQPNSFSFGRVAFENGQMMTADLARVIDPQKKGNPKDVKRALQMAEQHKEKLSAMDADKRADIEEKDMWLNAKKRAQGEKVKDDMSLLKKALKRKEKQKKKSEKAWDARTEGVRKGKEARQQKREDNLQKRKDEKGSKGSKKKKGVKSKAKSRPGFEGSFRAGGKSK